MRHFYNIIKILLEQMGREINNYRLLIIEETWEKFDNNAVGKYVSNKRENPRAFN